MTKAELNTAVLEAITKSNDKKVTKEKLGANIKEIMDLYLARATSKDEHPNMTNDDGDLMVWCLKHNDYELATEFAPIAKSKTGYHNKCRIADYQWKDYLKSIRTLQDELSAALDTGDYEKAAEINTQLKSLTFAKDSGYDYPDDDEIERISPKKKEA